MTATQSKRLKVGDRVCWYGDADDAGTVRDQNPHMVVVAWDNGQTGTLSHDDAATITKEGAA